jgi:NDP-sugar pyrophosphorylase family protein
MAQVNGKPFLEHLVGQLRAQSFEDLILCVGHLADQVKGYFGDGKLWGVRIAYSEETSPLGTAGAIRKARRLIDGTFVVLNGDSYLDADFGAMVQLHQRRRSADHRTVGTIATVAVDDAAAYGTLECDNRGRILCFREKAAAGAGWINGGVYVLQPDVLDHIPDGRAVSIERETFPLLLERGDHLYACPVEGFFVDIGTPQGYRRFQRYVEEEGL